MRVSIASRMLAIIAYTMFLLPSVGLTYISEFCRKKSRLFSLITAIMAIMLPCVLASCRGITVGVDVEVYAKPVYLLSGSAKSYRVLLNSDLRFEPGYLLIGYISSHYFKSFHAMLFLTQLLIVAPVFMGAMKLHKHIPAWASMLCFYSFFYIETFNIMRQGIAVAFVFLAFTELFNKKYVKSLVWLAIGLQFHSSAIIGYVLIVLILLLGKLKSRKLRITIVFFVPLVILIAMLFVDRLMAFIASRNAYLGSYINKYADKMMDQNTYFTQLGFANVLELLFRWGGLLVPIFAYNGIVSKRSDLQYPLLVGIVIGVLIYTAVFVVFHSSYGYRISFYLEILLVPWVASLQKQSNTMNRVHINTRSLVFFMCNLACFLVLYIWRGTHGTLPFYLQHYGF